MNHLKESICLRDIIKNYEREKIESFQTLFPKIEYQQLKIGYYKNTKMIYYDKNNIKNNINLNKIDKSTIFYYDYYNDIWFQELEIECNLKSKL